MDITFSERLVEIRQALGISQDRMAEAGGVGKRAQVYYEHGERMPDVSYLQNIAYHLGVDLQYLLMKVPTPTPESALAPDELALVAAYRKAPSVGKEFIRQASGMAGNITAHAPAAEVPAAKKRTKKA